MKPRVHRVLKESLGLVVVPTTREKRCFDIYLKTGELHSQTVYLTSVDDIWYYPEGA